MEITLLFVAIAIDQGGGCATWEPDIGPFFERVTVLQSRPDDALGHEAVKLPTASRPRLCRRYDRQAKREAQREAARETQPEAIGFESQNVVCDTAGKTRPAQTEDEILPESLALRTHAAL